MNKIVNKKKQLIGLLFGLTAGFSFAIFAWGIDGYLLARANAGYPFIKFIPGLIISLMLGGFVGWLTVKLQNLLLSVCLWIGYSLILSRIFIWLPVKAAPVIIGFFDDYLGNFLNYPYYHEMDQISWVGFIIIAIVAILGGLLENLLIDQAIFSSGSISLAIPLVVSFLLFCLAGNSIDGMFNKHIREPILTVNNLLQFASENNIDEVPIEVNRAMHLSAVKTIKEYLPMDRTLIMSNFDSSFGQIDILIKFHGNWVKCSTVYNQVTYCKQIFEPPKSLLSGHYGGWALMDNVFSGIS